MSPMVVLALPFLIPSMSVSCAEKQIKQSLEAPAGTVVEVRNVSGSIDIRAHDAPTVELDARLECERDELKIEESGGRIVIEVGYPRERRFARNVKSAHLKLKVPKATQLSITAVSANVTVGGTSGPLELETVSGDVKIQTSASSVRFSTVSGDVRFDGASAKLNGKSVSGEIELSAEAVAADLSTVSGDLEVKAGKLEALEVKTVSGDIEVRGRFEASGKFELETKSGDVEIHQPAGANGRFSYKTFSGDFVGDLPITRAGSRGVEAGRGDGPNVSIRTFAGDARVVEE